MKSSSDRAAQLWVVEEFYDGKWRATVGCGVTFISAEAAMRTLSGTANPDATSWRIVKYARRVPSRGPLSKEK